MALQHLNLAIQRQGAANLLTTTCATSASVGMPPSIGRLGAGATKLNGLDPRAWLASVLRRIADHPASQLDELLPWNCTERAAKLAA